MFTEDLKLSTMNGLLEKINKSALKFLSPLTPEKTYEVIVVEALKLLDGKYGSVILEIDGDLKRVYGSMPFTYSIKNRKKANTYKAFNENKVIIADITKAHPEIVKFDIKWTIFIPLSYQNKPIGVITINTDKEDVTLLQKEMDVLKLYGALASMAIKKTQLYSEAQKTLEVRDFFIALAAQELRTPLTTINGYVQLLQNKLNKDTQSQESKWVSKLSIESAKLTKIVQQLLEVNKVKAGTVQYALQDCDMRDIMKKAIHSIQILYPSRIFNYEMKLDKTTRTIGDCNKLKSVIESIIDNAVKYSPAESPITITSRFDKKNFIITVEDVGKGISKKDLPYIFEGFYKPDYNQEHGLIIGLFMAKSIIDYHKGKIQIKSAQGKGTSVEILLPVNK